MSTDNKKTTAAWLSQLPEPWRTQALENTGAHDLAARYDSARTALVNAFVFSESPQGMAYWNNFYARLRDGKITLNAEATPVPEKKTAMDWLREWDSPHKERALHYCADLHPFRGRSRAIVTGLSEALRAAFDWGLTHEGYDHWRKIHRALLEHTEPPTPVKTTTPPKTALEHIQAWGHPYRELALAAIKKAGRNPGEIVSSSTSAIDKFPCSPDAKVSSIKEALTIAFRWDLALKDTAFG